MELRGCHFHPRHKGLASQNGRFSKKLAEIFRWCDAKVGRGRVRQAGAAFSDVASERIGFLDRDAVGYFSGMAESFEITDELRARVGIESDPWTFEVTTTGIRAFARGVGYRDVTYFDRAVARGAGYGDLPAPPTYLGFPVFIPSDSDPAFSAPRGDGPGGGLNHGLKGLLDGGAETVYERPIVAGDELVVTSKLTNLETKTSGSLGVMLIITNEATYKDAKDGAVVARQRSQAIYY